MIDRAKFLPLFVEEAREHLAALEGGLSALGDGASAPLVAELFRHAHSLKGMAATMEFDPIRDLAHGMEEALDRVRSGKIAPSPPLLGALGGGIDGITAMVEAARAGGLVPPAAPWIAALRAALAVQPPPRRAGDDAQGTGRKAPARASAAAPPTPARAGAAAHPETVRVERAASAEAKGPLQKLRVVVRIRSDAPMPAARALVLLRQIGRAGAVLDASPSAEELSRPARRGRGPLGAEPRLTVVVETRTPPERLKKSLGRGAEVESVEISLRGTGRERPARVDAHPELEQAPVPEAKPSSAVTGGRTPSPAGARGRAPSDAPRASEAPASPRAAAAPPALPPAAPAPAPERARAAPAPAEPPSEPPPEPAPEPPMAAPLRVAADVLDRFLESVGELVILRGRLSRALGNDESARADVERLRKVSERLFRDVMRMRLVPFDAVAHRYQAAVRELSRQLARPIALRVSGGDVRLDRAMLEGLSDPIQHLLRNCAGHGLEPPQERRAAGKEETGTILLALERTSDGVRLRVSDDGRGMDPARIRRHAVEAGFLTPERAAAVSDEEALLLTTIPGFSTATGVTELSGRGVGMDVVRTAVESLGGKLAIRSRTGRGTQFEMLLPLTTAIIPAFLVRCGGRSWAVPLSAVRRSLDVRPGEIASDGRLHLNGGPGAEVHDLADLLENSAPKKRPGNGSAAGRRTRPADGDRTPLNGGSRTALLVGAGAGTKAEGERIAAVLVDGILGQQDIVVKPLGPPLNELRAYSGVTLLEDGSLALILDLANLLPAGDP